MNIRGESVLGVGHAGSCNVERCRRKTDKLLAQGRPAEKKQLLRTWVHGIKVAPERLEVEITYRIPEPLMDCMVAGARYVVEKKIPGQRIGFEYVGGQRLVTGSRDILVAPV